MSPRGSKSNASASGAAPREAYAVVNAGGAASSGDEGGAPIVVAPSGARAGPTLYQCHLCETAITDANDLVFAGRSSTAYHTNCKSAVRYFERLSSKTPEDKAALAKFKREKPLEYRYRCMELRTDRNEGGFARRGAGERARVFTLLEEVRFYSRSYKSQYVLMLSKRAFIAWRYMGVSVCVCQVASHPRRKRRGARATKNRVVPTGLTESLSTTPFRAMGKGPK